MKAYALVNTTANKASGVLTLLRSSQDVKSAEAITGPYDIIVTLEAEDMDDLGKLVTKVIHGIEGIESTLTCVVFNI